MSENSILPIPTEGESEDIVRRLSHDLRSPLNQIIGYSELMLEDLQEDATGAIKTRLEVLRAKAKRMVGCITQRAEQSPCRAVDFQRDVRVALEVPLLEVQGTVSELRRIGVTGPDIARIDSAIADLDALSSGQIQVPIAIAEEVLKLPNPSPPSCKPPSSQSSRPNGLHRQACVLVVDDQAANRALVARCLEQEGHRLVFAENGEEALEAIAKEEFDTVVLDLVMPQLGGGSVLRVIRSTESTKDLPVVITSGLDSLSTVLQCVEDGADDYLTKPFDPPLLRARVRGLVEKKQSRDRERERAKELESALKEIQKQKEISDKLLLNILPAMIAKELQEKGTVDPMYFEDVTIGMLDFAKFTTIAERLSADELVTALDRCFTGFDRIMARYGLEKLKTVGDAYIFVGGLPLRSPSHPVDVMLACFEILEFLSEETRQSGIPWKARIGINTGPVIAGVVGIHKFSFDVWGDTINFASRMELSGAPSRINVSQTTYPRIKDFFQCEPGRKVETKDGKVVDMYFVERLLPTLSGVGDSDWPPARLRRRYHIYFREELKSCPSRAALGLENPVEVVQET